MTDKKSKIGHQGSPNWTAGAHRVTDLFEIASVSLRKTERETQQYD